MKNALEETKPVLEAATEDPAAAVTLISWTTTEMIIQVKDILLNLTILLDHYFLSGSKRQRQQQEEES